ncbi:MAG: archease [Acidimicrobiales bacterium]
MAHTADTTIEAWAPDRAGCVAEAVRGLIDGFVDVPAATARGSVPVEFADDDNADLLVSALEEVLFLLEVAGQVVVGIELADVASDGIVGFVDVAPVGAVRQIGPAPKAVTRHELRLQPNGSGGWTARVTVDV